MFIVIVTKKSLQIFECTTFTIKIVVLMTISVTLQFVKFVINFEF